MINPSASIFTSLSVPKHHLASLHFSLFASVKRSNVIFQLFFLPEISTSVFQHPVKYLSPHIHTFFNKTGGKKKEEQGKVRKKKK